ncbi:MAG: hypothetical protein HQM10_19275 [Candidatus Riflebacteria bacterium]|nr:hypothetical protein [Candidatus Riflebacteria bacterium]
MEKKIWICYMYQIVLLVFIAMPAFSSVDEQNFEGFGTIKTDFGLKVKKRYGERGVTLQGCYGLLTVPTPNLEDERKFAFSFKMGPADDTTRWFGNEYKLKKNEKWAGLTYRITDRFEFSANGLSYDRVSSPDVGYFNSTGFANGFGLKYTVASQDICIGFHWAPISANEVNKLDLFQVEHFRNLYITVTEDLRENIYAFLNLKSCYSALKEIEVAPNQMLEVGQKNFLVGTLGLEYKDSPVYSLILEAQMFNYRDLIVENPQSYSFNIGYRRANKDFQLELAAFDIHSNPRGMIGVNWSWN